MSRLSTPNLPTELDLQSSSPVVYTKLPSHTSPSKQSLFKTSTKKKKPYHLDLPDLQIKKSRTLSTQLSESTRGRSSPYVSDTMQMNNSESVYRPKKAVKKKAVTIPTENFVQVVEIESFKKFNFMQEVLPKEYDVFNKKCCMLF